MPFQSVDNYDNFVDNFVNNLADLHSIIVETNTSFISIVGDMNTNLSSHFGEEFIISDADFLNNNSFTCVSDTHAHCICSRNMHNLIQAIDILVKLPSLDHLPLQTIFNINISEAL